MSAQVGESRLVPQWSLGDRLRKIRRMMGISQAEFAAQLGQNQKTYAAWELDTSHPRNVVAMAKRVEAMTGVPAGWVLDTESRTVGYSDPSSPAPRALSLVKTSPARNRRVTPGNGSSPADSSYAASPGLHGSASRVHCAHTA